MFAFTMFPSGNNPLAKQILDDMAETAGEIQDRLNEVFANDVRFAAWRHNNRERDQLSNYTEWIGEVADASTEARVIFFTNLDLYAHVLGVDVASAGLLMNVKLGEIFTSDCPCSDCAKLRQLFPHIETQVSQRN